MAEFPLHLLACPVCHAPLLQPTDAVVVCSGCARRYPVRDGIPVLIAGEAENGGEVAC